MQYFKKVLAQLVLAMVTTVENEPGLVFFSLLGLVLGSTVVSPQSIESDD